MTRRFALHLVTGAALVVSAWLYTTRLDQVPPRLGLDEAHFGVHAHAIATTGRNLNGDQWPLFISLADPLGDNPTLPWGQSWYQPLLFYLIALALKVLPFSEASIRVPSALIGGVANVALAFLAARALSGRRSAAWAAGVLMALCPAHLILSRQALDYIMPIPFTLAWLWGLARYTRRPRTAVAAVLGLILGVGCYSYITSWVIMPLLLALSWVVFWRTGTGSGRATVASLATFAVPLLLLVPWVIWHREMVSNIVAQYSVNDGTHSSALQALASGEPLAGVLQRTMGIYWDHFNPSFLFVIGGAGRNVSTGQVGVFLWPVAVLLPVGLWSIRRGDATRLPAILVVGLAAAPALAAIKGTPFAIQRATLMLPFASVIAAIGVGSLWASGNRAARMVAIGLLGAAVAQFAFFQHDYFSGYPDRSARSYDPTAFGDAATFVIRSGIADEAPVVEIAAPMYDASAKWRFYTTKFGRTDLLARTRYFSGSLAMLSDPPGGTLAIVPAEGPPLPPGGWELVHTTHQPSGDAAMYVVKRTGAAR